jgi:hypothetical protein
MSGRAFIFTSPESERKFKDFKARADAECALRSEADPSHTQRYEEERELKCMAESHRLLAELGREHIERSRQDFEAGDKSALLEALYKYVCTGRDGPMPPWIARAIETLYSMTMEMGLFASWDEVFAPPHQKNVKLPARRSAFFKRWLIWVEFTELRKTMGRDDAFREAGKRHGMSYAKAKDLYYTAEGMLHSDDPAVAARARRLIAGAEDELILGVDAERSMSEAANEYKISSSSFARDWL